MLLQVIDENEASGMYQDVCTNSASNIETLYFQLAECSFEMRDYKKSLENSNKTINIIKFFEKDYHNKKDIKNIYKKIIMKIHSYFIIGKCYAKASDME